MRVRLQPAGGASMQEGARMIFPLLSNARVGVRIPPFEKGGRGGIRGPGWIAAIKSPSVPLFQRGRVRVVRVDDDY